MRQYVTKEFLEVWDKGEITLLPKDEIHIEPMRSPGFLAVSMHQYPKGTRFWLKIPAEDITITIKETK